jgi:hypothetical protein
MTETIRDPSRRFFLGQMTLTVGGTAVAALLPASLLQAAPSCDAGPQVAYPDPCGDWRLDDMCSAYPPYTFRVHRGYAQHRPIHHLAADIDRDWVG